MAKIQNWYTGKIIIEDADGTYTDTHINQYGCDSIVTLDLTIIISPSVSILTIDPTTGIILEAIVTGGISPYTYLWRGPGGFTSTDEAIDNLETGEYCIQVTDAEGCVSNEECAQIYVNSITDLNISEFNIYPNPTSSYIHLEFTTTKIGDYTLKVMSYNGAEVYRDELRKFNGEFSTTIDLSTFAKGTYLVEVSYEDHIIYRKILLQQSLVNI